MAKISVRPSNQVNPDEHIKFEWPDGTGDFLYLSVNSTTKEIDVISDANNTGQNRHYNLVFNGDANAASPGIAQAKAVLHITQQINNLIVATFSDTYSIYDDEKAGHIGYE